MENRKLALVTALLTYAEASAFLNVKVNTLYAWVSRGVIPYVRVGPRVVRFRRDDLDSWLERRRFAPDSGSAPPASGRAN
jgi:excisionase family DNA binding protein